MTTDAIGDMLVSSAPTGPIIARAGRYYRTTRYIMAMALVLYGAWSIYDGFYNWQEPHWSQYHPNEQPYPPMSIHLDQAMGLALPPLALLLLVRTLYNSRGAYRLENGVVEVPGHPPVPLDNIQAVDRKLWDRKGIAYVEYELPAASPRRGTFRLDDFVYDRSPTDAIFKAIEQSLLKPSTAQPLKMPPAYLPPRPNKGIGL